jgi:transcriptional regulator with XRE-family HTH domain
MLDHCVTVLGVKSYANLARVLDIDPSQLSKMRTGKEPVWNTVLLALHELTGIPIAQLKDLAGIRERVRPYHQK